MVDASDDAAYVLAVAGNDADVIVLGSHVVEEGYV